MNSIGLDAHSSTFTLAYVNSRGGLGHVYHRPTTEEALIDVVGRIPGPKQLTVEECHLAQWVKHTLARYVDRLIICDPRRNKWIAEDTYADDQTSAIKLARLLHGNYIKEIRHTDDHGAELRSLFLHYFDITRQCARFKNKAKATFRQVAVRVGNGVYADPEPWLEQLKDFRHLHIEARDHLASVAYFEGIKDRIYGHVVRMTRQVPLYRRLLKVPGVGPVIASGYIAIIDTPHRFSTENKLWAYAGLGNNYHESDEAVYHDKSSKTGNRVLKWLVMQQFKAAVWVARKPNRYKIKYEALLRRGLGRKTARRHVCRGMLSSIRAMWMKEEVYREAI